MKLLLLALCLCLAACGGGGSGVCSPTVQVEGDSIAKRLVLNVNAPVTNTAIGSTTTADRISGSAGFQPFPQGISGSVYVTNWGVNDAYQRLPLPQYKANLRLIAAQPGAVLMTPTPMDLTQPYTADDSAYAQAVRDIGVEMRVPVIDTNAWFLAQPNWPSGLSDGVHPTPAWQAAMEQQVIDPAVNARIAAMCS